jgi:hypothetical protein
LAAEGFRAEDGGDTRKQASKPQRHVASRVLAWEDTATDLRQDRSIRGQEIAALLWPLSRAVIGGEDHHQLHLLFSSESVIPDTPCTLRMVSCGFDFYQRGHAIVWW